MNVDTPYRKVNTYPSPLSRDILFYELRKTDLAAYSVVPEYGTPHPDKNKYPKHKLIFAELSDRPGEYRWWYAADRTEQDKYNAQITYPYSGNREYPRYTRTYLLPRDGYAPLLPGAADPVVSGAILVAQAAKPADPPLASLYLEVTRVYDKLPGQDDTEGIGTSQLGGGYTIERPLGTKDFFRLVWTLTLPKAIAESASADGREDYAACPIPGYEDLRLVDETISSPEDNEISRTIRRVYIKEQATAKIDRTRVTANVEPPDRFISYLERQRRGQVVTAQVADTPESWSGTGSFSPTQSAVTMQTMLVGEKQTEEIRFSLAPLVSRVWDPNLATHVESTAFSVRTSELTAWLANTANINPATDFYETAAANTEWTVVSRLRMPAGSLSNPMADDPTKTGYVLDYYGVRTAAWPRVLLELNQQSYSVKDRSGNLAHQAMVWAPRYKEAWSGLCRARVYRWWQKTAYAEEVKPIQSLTPTAIEVDWPIGSVSVLPCLHLPYTFEGTTGTTNPMYGFTEFSASFPETSMKSASETVPAPDWPDKLISAFDAEPYRGGYLYTRVDIYKPY